MLISSRQLTKNPIIKRALKNLKYFEIIYFIKSMIIGNHFNNH